MSRSRSAILAPADPLWLPEPQKRVIPPPGPGKREDGQPWYGSATRRDIAEDKVNMMRYSTERLAITEDHPKQRDVRRGDKWLPWHFESACDDILTPA